MALVGVTCNMLQAMLLNPLLPSLSTPTIEIVTFWQVVMLDAGPYKVTEGLRGY